MGLNPWDFNYVLDSNDSNPIGKRENRIFSWKLLHRSPYFYDWTNLDHVQSGEPITVASDIWFSDWPDLGHMLHFWRQVVPIPTSPGHLDCEWGWGDHQRWFRVLLGEEWGEDPGQRGIKITKTHPNWCILFPSTLFSQFTALYNTHYCCLWQKAGHARSTLELKKYLMFSVQPVSTAFFSVFVVVWEHGKEVNIMCLGTVLMI